MISFLGNYSDVHHFDFFLLTDIFTAFCDKFTLKLENN